MTEEQMVRPNVRRSRGIVVEKPPFLGVGEGTLQTNVLMTMIIVSYLVLCVWVWPYTMDDAFIAFRYAKHIGDGIGPIWNLADRAHPVEGFTSFLYVWLLGGARFVMGADVILYGKLFGVLASLILATCLIWEMQRRRLSTVSGAVALSFFLLPFTALNAVSGMETSLFMLWNWLCAITGLRLLEAPAPRMTWMFVLFGLLGTLTRPEFAFTFALMAAYVWWCCPAIRPKLLRAILVLYVLPGLAVTAWRYSYYGDIVPNPFYVKQKKGLTSAGVFYVLSFLTFCALPYLVLVASAWRSLWARHRHLVVIVALSLGIQGAYFSTTSVTMGWWYRFLLPQVPLLAFCAAQALQARQTTRHTPVAFWQYAAGLLIILVFLAHAPVITRFLMFHEAHEVRYREIGRRLEPFAAENRWLTYYDVGSIVYESEWNTMDIVGLNTHRRNLKPLCALKTDVVLQFSFSPSDIANPCPGLYLPLADLPFSKQDPIVDSYMRVFVRNDISYAAELRYALLDTWPEQFTRPTNWLAWYHFKYHPLFGPLGFTHHGRRAISAVGQWLSERMTPQSS